MDSKYIMESMKLNEEFSTQEFRKSLSFALRTILYKFMGGDKAKYLSGLILESVDILLTEIENLEQRVAELEKK